MADWRRALAQARDHSSQNTTSVYNGIYNSKGAAWEHAGMIAHTWEDASYHVTNTQTQQTRHFLKTEGQVDQALVELDIENTSWVFYL